MIELPVDMRVTQISDEGPTPSFFIRFRDPIQRLTRNWTYLRSDSPDADAQVAAASVLFVQRAYSLWSRRLVDQAKARGIPVIYETDDFLLDLPAQSGFRVTAQQKDCIAYMLATADMVTCSTEALAVALRPYASQVQILENYAVPFPPAKVEAARRSQYKIAVVNTDYFKLIQGKHHLFQALQRALVKLNCHLAFFGTIDPQMALLKHDFPDQVTLVSSFIPQRMVFWEHLLNEGINAGVIPLEDIPEHRFKSDIKFVDFGQLAAPAIYNNSHCYKHVVHRETGYICDGSTDGWYAGLSYFADPRQRNECGKGAYVYAQQRMLETYSTELSQVVTSALALARPAVRMANMMVAAK